MLRSEDQAGLPVSFPEGMVSCKSGCELGSLPLHSCLAMWFLQLLLFCMGHKVQSWSWSMCASAVDDVRVHVPVCQVCSFCVFVSAALFEGWNLEVCLSLCPW